MSTERPLASISHSLIPVTDERRNRCPHGHVGEEVSVDTGNGTITVVVSNFCTGCFPALRLERPNPR